MSITGITQFYNTNIYDIFLFPFLLAYYISLLTSLILFAGYLVYSIGEKIIYLMIFITVITLIIFIIWLHIPILPSYITYLTKSSSVVFLPTLPGITHFLLQSLCLLLVTIFLPISSGIIFHKQSVQRFKGLYLSFVIISGILAPPDPISHLFISFLMFFLFFTSRFFTRIICHNNKHIK